MLHGPQQGVFDLSFAVPSLCADRVASGQADIGNIPVIEFARQQLRMVRGAGIAARGPVRSILLVSKHPLTRIRTLAADTSSRTSVVLSRIILEKRYGVEPVFAPHAPDLDTMLATADAALIIGDPALRVDPGSIPYQTFDLAEEWVNLTGLPMVFALWAGRDIPPDAAQALLDSCRYGRSHLNDVIRAESSARGIPETLARDYLTHHIVNELEDRDYQGLDLYLRYAREMELVCDTPPLLSRS